LLHISNSEKNQVNNNTYYNDFPISIAPMMDRTDSHFRKLMRLITKKTLLYTEMINVNSIVYGSIERFTNECNTEEPVALQIGISDTKLVPKISKILSNTNFSEININCGCPSNKVVNGNFGASMMKNPELVGNIIYSLKNLTDKPISVKTRIGIDNYDSKEFLYKFIRSCTKNGAEKIILHARKAILKGLSPHENRNIPPLNYDRAKSVKDKFHNCKIYVNGGIKTLDDVNLLLNYFDGVMIGRAAWNAPWMFSKIDNNYISRLNVIDNYLDYIENKSKLGYSKTVLFRPIFNLFHGIKGSKVWKQSLNNFSNEHRSLSELFNLAIKIENSKLP